jgi:quinol monooxygenase YgiN
MYARTTAIWGDPQAIDEGIANVRDDVMPMVQGMGGCVGLSMLADRASGRCIVTTAWATEQAMHTAAEHVRASRERAAQILGGTPEIAEWEIAVMHRMHMTPEGARTRVIWGHTEPGHVDDMLAIFRMTMLAKIEELAGFASCNLMIARHSGRVALTVTYDSAAAMEAATDRAVALRQEAEATTTMGIEIDEIGEFDVVLAHLRVPETV